MKNNLKYLIIMLCGLQIISCSTFGNSNHKLPPQTLEEVIQDQGSMTQTLENLNHNFSVALIKNGIVSNEYTRISSLKLENQPVIVAVVTTNVANHTFVTILRNANTTPIGKMLFAKDSNIKRTRMTVDVMTVKNVNSNIAHEYINKIGYVDETHLVMRTSMFSHEKETLSIIEYILPSMTKYFSK